MTMIMAIESSCDETACAIVKDGSEILSNIVSSQINVHTQFGGKHFYCDYGSSASGAYDDG